MKPNSKNSGRGTMEGHQPAGSAGCCLTSRWNGEQRPSHTAASRVLAQGDTMGTMVNTPPYWGKVKYFAHVTFIPQISLQEDVLMLTLRMRKLRIDEMK